MFDVEAVVAVRIELTGTLQVRGNVVAGLGVEGRHPLQTLDRLLVAAVAATGSARGNELFTRGVPARIGGVGATGNRAIPIVGDAAAGVGVAAVEAILPLRERVAVADGRVTWRGRQRGRVERGRHLTGDNRHRGVLVARGH